MNRYRASFKLTREGHEIDVTVEMDAVDEPHMFQKCIHLTFGPMRRFVEDNFTFTKTGGWLVTGDSEEEK